MKNFHFLLMTISLGIVAFCPSASAQDTTAAGQGTYGQLSALSDKIAILKAQAQIAQLQAEISAAKRNTDNSTMTSNHVSSYSPSIPRPFSANPANSDDIPHIISISGRGRRLSALLQTPQGAQIETVPGTILENGMMVKSISPTSVKVIENNQVFFLPFVGVEMSGANVQPGG